MRTSIWRLALYASVFAVLILAWSLSIAKTDVAIAAGAAVALAVAVIPYVAARARDELDAREGRDVSLPLETRKQTLERKRAAESREDVKPHLDWEPKDR